MFVLCYDFLAESSFSFVFPEKGQKHSPALDTIKKKITDKIKPSPRTSRAPESNHENS